MCSLVDFDFNLKIKMYTILKCEIIYLKKFFLCGLAFEKFILDKFWSCTDPNWFTIEQIQLLQSCYNTYNKAVYPKSSSLPAKEKQILLIAFHIVDRHNWWFFATIICEVLVLKKCHWFWPNFKNENSWDDMDPERQPESEMVPR